RGAFADPLLPLRTDLGEVVGEVERGARAVGAVDHADLYLRQRRARVEGADAGIVPGGDVAHEDPGEHLAGEPQLPRLQAVEVDHRHHAADRRGELAQPRLGQLRAGQRLVAGAEVDRAGLDLGDAAARSDRLV